MYVFVCIYVDIYICTNRIYMAKLSKQYFSQALVAHAYNPSYSGGRDQENCGLKPARANSLQDPISKKLFTKKGWWSGSRCRPSV
jgi:hypothetical protein